VGGAGGRRQSPGAAESRGGRIIILNGEKNTFHFCCVKRMLNFWVKKYFNKLF